MIYLDNNATTPVDPRVRDVLVEHFSLNAVGNPHSEHAAGFRAHAAVEEARAKVARLIGVEPAEIIFTSGATEANNLVLQGLVSAAGCRDAHVVVSAIEHKCVLETALRLRERGARVDVVPVRSDGVVDMAHLRDCVTRQTTVVSVMAANNEVGVLQPIAEIAALCNAFDVPFHTDGAQAVGKVPVDAARLGIDLMSLSAHKIYGPIGIGALYLSSAAPRFPQPLLFGGGQERGYRAGTLSAPLCAAFGVACSIAAEERESEATELEGFRRRMVERLRELAIQFHEVLPDSPRLPGLMSLRLPGIDASQLVGALQPEVAISTHAACAAGSLQPSHVLTALGLSADEAGNVIRIGFGRFNTLKEIDRAAVLIAQAIQRQGISARHTA